MKWNKKLAALCVCFTIWIFSSTFIIVNIYNRNVEIHELEEMPVTNSLPVYYAINDLSVSNNLMNTFSLLGWAFVLPEEKTDTKDVSLIFKSDQKIYEVTATVVQDLSLLERLINSGLQTNGKNVGVSSLFSPLLFKEGEYQLYLCCYKNGERSGIVSTDYFFKKTLQEFVACEKISEETDKPINEELIYSNGCGFVDSMKIRNDQLIITGWIFLDGEDSTYQNVYIGIRNADGSQRFFNGCSFGRIDLVGYQNNKLNHHSGFSATICINGSPPAQDDITVYVVCGGKWFEISPSVDFE